MSNSSTIHQVTYAIRIRSQYPERRSPVFRGTLETRTGQKFEFSTLAELDGLLCEVCGWIDPLQSADEGDETETHADESFPCDWSPNQDFKEELK